MPWSRGPNIANGPLLGETPNAGRNAKRKTSYRSAPWGIHDGPELRIGLDIKAAEICGRISHGPAVSRMEPQIAAQIMVRL